MISQITMIKIKHGVILKLLKPNIISKMIKHIFNQLDENYLHLSRLPPKIQLNTVEIIMLLHSHPALSEANLSKILHKNQTNLPKIINQIIQSKFVFTNLKPTQYYLLKQKQIQQNILLPLQYQQCQCI